VLIKAGSSVTFTSDFAIHPLVGGTFEGGMKKPDAASPITPQTMGMTATFKFPNAGAYGFYCNVHASVGMIGAVFVK
jgi:plastocyanin